MNCPSCGFEHEGGCGKLETVIAIAKLKGWECAGLVLLHPDKGVGVTYSSWVTPEIEKAIREALESGSPLPEERLLSQ